MDTIASQRPIRVATAVEEARNAGLRHRMTWQSESGSTDRELTARFERDVVPLREPLYRHALRLSRNHADAQDLVQDTMVKAFANFHSYQPNTNVSAWVHRILLNTYLNAYRKKRRQPVQHPMDKITEAQLAVFAQHPPRGLRSAEDEALDVLPDNDIKAAMQALPQQFRIVVFYADVEGLRYKEIAEIMAIPQGTVMSRLHRGRRQLRRLLTSVERLAAN
ncbi:MAG: polymerase sigma-70 factor, subfamily [Mycobacterium sp.]|jgi:RNA polymerase sigma-70 factor (ECF subfamily)|nr:polymerase sigma-70 factor, subfamily [Mycobacterium sp.]